MQPSPSAKPRAKPTTSYYRQTSPRRDFLISLLLVLVTIGVYWPVRHYEFINFDDPYYVYENNFVIRGLSRDGIVWAFSQLTGEATYWHPVTWLSHMLDCQLFGTNAGMHHLVNVLFHAANAVLLFLVLKRMTGAPWRSAVVAALFAWHPLQVDSVAWVTERKNVLSTCLGLLTMLAYLRYVRQPGAGRYALVMVCFGLGLMAKPILVTMPLILLLLDIWPLQRFQISTLDSQVSTFFRLVGEKMPLLVLSAASAAVTIIGHAELKSLRAFDGLPIGARLANALVSYVRYLGKLIWPVDLAVFYPYPEAWSPLAVISATLCVTGTTALVIYLVRQRPYLAVGWFWYVGTLLPVIGLVQAGSQSMADRFSYVPMIGLFIMVVWSVADLMRVWPHRKTAQQIITVVVLTACLAVTHTQLPYWRNSVSLWTRAVSCTSRNSTAHGHLGNSLVEKGHLAEAIPHYRDAIEFDGRNAQAHYNLGVLYFKAGRVDEAIGLWQKATGINPNYADAYNNLGLAFFEMGRVDEGIAHWKKAIAINPNHAASHRNIGNAYLKSGRAGEAVLHLKQTIAINPGDANTHNELAAVLFTMGLMDEAIVYWQRAVELDPRNGANYFSLGLAYFKKGLVDKAVAHYQKAVEINPHDADIYNNLGHALFKMGRISEALTHLQKAVEIEPQSLTARNNLAWALATGPVPPLRNGVQAIALAEQSLQLAGGSNPELLGTLAASYAEAGQFSNAVATAQQALQLAAQQGNQLLSTKLHRELGLYQLGLPCRDNPQYPSPGPERR